MFVRCRATTSLQPTKSTLPFGHYNVSSHPDDEINTRASRRRRHHHRHRCLSPHQTIFAPRVEGARLVGIEAKGD